LDIKLAANAAQYTIEHLTTNLMKGRYNVYGALHAHPVFHIMYILEGNGKFTIGSTTTEALPGMLYIINPNVPHKFVFGYEEPLTNLECTFQLLNGSGNAAELHFFDFTSGGLQIPPLATNRPFVVPSRLKPLLTEGFERILDLYGSPLLRNHFGLMVADLMARVETIVHSTVKADH
jgi:mannose-6-phosphate isomerase-like protein (cupin superfamily)